MRDIKFKYVYEGPGKTQFSRTFTLDQIEGGDQFDEISDSPLLKDYRIVGRYEFTGLLDKNGKEIYEGDIIKYISIHDDAYMLDKDSRITGTVVYYQERCQFLPQEIRENHKGGHYISTWAFTEDIELIGNIHENKNLLS